MEKGVVYQKSLIRHASKKKRAYEKFVDLLEKGLKGVHWREVEKGRRDRC